MIDSECGMMNDLKHICEELDIRNLQTLSIAYVGDAYFHLFVRVNLLKYKYKVSDLHNLSSKIVSAVAQSKAYQEIENMLTEEEKDFFRRGRNAKSHASHSATNAEYHNSTGLETLLGMLFIKGSYARLDEIAGAVFHTIMNEDDINDK